ncbi:MAG: hypothetical protein QGG64_01695, partial [Candidatus Latescibacteria bacterium]|nr:hypothetical protein [Candidatus Latescibacterota bacterium]
MKKTSKNINRLSARFLAFATECRALQSPLYTRLSEAIACDVEILSLAAQATSNPEMVIPMRPYKFKVNCVAPQRHLS